MTQFLVTWQIDEEADTAQEAAEKAFRRIRRTIPNDPGNCAVYDVSQIGRPGFVRVDLGGGTIEAQGESMAAKIARALVRLYIDCDEDAAQVAEEAGCTVDDVHDFMRAALVEA